MGRDPALIGVGALRCLHPWELCNRFARRYAEGMRSVVSPLLTRLRRHPVAITWVFVAVTLTKSAVATACLTDGMDAARAVASTLTTATDAPAPSSVDADSAAPCWHAGTLGCHCGCADATALPVALRALRPAALFADRPRTVQPLRRW